MWRNVASYRTTRICHWHRKLSLDRTRNFSLIGNNTMYKTLWSFYSDAGIPSSRYLPYFPLVRSFQIICTRPKTCVTFRNILTFTWWGVLVPQPNAKLEYHSFSAIWNRLCNMFAATLYMPYTGRLLRLQPEDTPYRGDRDPFKTDITIDLDEKCINFKESKNH